MPAARETATSAAQGARIFWMIGTIVVPIFLAVFDDNMLTDAIHSMDVLFCISFFAVILASAILYYAVNKTPPGIVTPSVLQDLEDRKRSEEEELIGPPSPEGCEMNTFGAEKRHRNLEEEEEAGGDTKSCLHMSKLQLWSYRRTRKEVQNYPLKQKPNERIMKKM